MTRRRVVAVLAVSALALSACGSSHSTPLGGNGEAIAHKKTATSTTKNSQKTPGPGLAVLSAPSVGSLYVQAQYSLNWSDLVDKKNNFAEWAMLAKPYVTPQMWQQIAQAQEASGPVNYHQAPYSRWIAEQRIESAQILQASTIVEAGVTPTSEVVQITYRILKSGLDYPSGVYGPVQVEQLQMQKTNGHWLVAKQYTSLYG